MQARQLPFHSYEGNEPHIFVSYSHRDSEQVFAIIGELSRLGFRLWYDEGIDPGTEWPEEIAAHLQKSAVFLLFVSPQSVESHNVRREINYAIDSHKRLLCVYLSPTELSPGMQMQLSLIQSIHYTYADPGDFYARLYKVLSQSLGVPDTAPSRPLKNPEAPPTEQTKPAAKGGRHSSLWVALGAVLCILAVALGILFWRNGRETPHDAISSPATADVSPHTQAAAKTAPPSLLESGSHGNNGGNLNSNMPSGFACEGGEWLYIAWDGGLYRLRADLTEPQKLAQADAMRPSLNIMGDWLYYQNLGPQRIRLDGSTAESLPYFSGSYSVGYGDSFYYADLSPGGGVMQMPLEGGTPQKLYTANVFTLYVDRGWLYFNDYAVESSVLRIRPGDTEAEAYIADATLLSFCVEDGWLYYHSSRYGFCRKNLESGKLEQIDMDYTGNIIVCENRLFYIKGDRLFGLSLPLGKPEELCRFPVEPLSFNVAGGQVFAATESELFHCPATGGEPTDISPLLEAAPLPD